MLTPIEIQGKVYKSGIGYDKKDVDNFSKDVLSNYEVLYKENVELTDKLSVLAEGIQYYKTIEKTLQKALVLAEKTSEESIEAAKKKASLIEKEAHSKAKSIVADAQIDLEKIHLQTINLVQQYDRFKVQFKKLAETQMEIMNSDSFHICIADLDAFTYGKFTEEKENYEIPVEDDNMLSETSDFCETSEKIDIIQEEKMPEEKAALQMTQKAKFLKRKEEQLTEENSTMLMTPKRTDKKYSDVKYYERGHLNRKEKESNPRTFEDMTVKLDSISKQSDKEKRSTYHSDNSDDDFEFINFEE